MCRPSSSRSAFQPMALELQPILPIQCNAPIEPTIQRTTEPTKPIPSPAKPEIVRAERMSPMEAFLRQLHQEQSFHNDVSIADIDDDPSLSFTIVSDNAALGPKNGCKDRWGKSNSFLEEEKREAPRNGSPIIPRRRPSIDLGMQWDPCRE